MLHVFVVVQPVLSETGETLYRVAIATKKGVPRYRPSLPRPAVFRLDDTFREVLLTKLVNGERASYHCSTKVRRQNRSLVEIMQATRKGQMEYAIQQSRLKPVRIPKSGKSTSTNYLQGIADEVKKDQSSTSLNKGKSATSLSIT